MIDSHVHLGGGKYASAEEWAAAAARLGVDGTVLVQNLGHTDNSELLAAKNDDRTAVVGTPESLDTAEALLEAGAIGFRLGPRGLHAAPGDLRIFDVLEAAGGVASVTMPYAEIAAPEFARVVDEHPSTTFRLEHVAAYDYATRDAVLDEFSPVIELARRPNTTIMWSGFFLYSQDGLPYRDAWPVLEASLAAFGPERIMWSGDWNRAGGTDDTYRADLDLLTSLPFVSPADVVEIVENTPRRVFGLSERIAS